MITKKIHYCWFGDKSLPDEAIKCIDTWKKFFPDYEIIEWNEKNFDVNYCNYTKEAYSQKKFAFVSDVARLYAVYTCGGIYMDIDVEIIKKFDDTIMDNDAFFGLESAGRVATGLVFGAEPKNWLVKKLMDDYKNLHFIKKDKSLNMTPCPVINSRIFIENGFSLDGEKIEHKKNVAVFPPDYFNPQGGYGKRVSITNNTVSVHHFIGSWFDIERKRRASIVKRLCEKYGNKRGMAIYKVVYLPFRIVSHLKGRFIS